MKKSVFEKMQDKMNTLKAFDATLDHGPLPEPTILPDDSTVSRETVASFRKGMRIVRRKMFVPAMVNDWDTDATGGFIDVETTEDMPPIAHYFKAGLWTILDDDPDYKLPLAEDQEAHLQAYGHVPGRCDRACETCNCSFCYKE